MSLTKKTTMIVSFAGGGGGGGKGPYPLSMIMAGGPGGRGGGKGFRTISFDDDVQMVVSHVYGWLTAAELSDRLRKLGRDLEAAQQAYKARYGR